MHKFRLWLSDYFHTVNIDGTEYLIKRANDFILSGLKAKDVLHVSSAIEEGVDYFITTDDRLLKKLHGRDDIQALNPVDIVGEIDEYNN